MKPKLLTLLPFLIAAASADADPARDRAVALITRQTVEIWSKGRVDLIPDIYAADFTGHFPSGPVHGHDGIRERVVAHRLAFPDWTEQIEDVVFEGERIAIRFTSTGTHLGPFQGMPPTGNRVRITELAMFRLADGKIAEQWVFPDLRSMQAQLNRVQ